MSLTRRDLLIKSASTFLLASTGCTQTRMKTQTGQLFVFVATGSFATPEVANGIYGVAFNPDTGQFDQPALATLTPNPMSTGQDHKRHILYSGMKSAAQGSDQSQITAYAVEHGRLKKLNAMPAGGLDVRTPVVDRSGSNLLYLNYESGNTISRRLNPDGSIGGIVSQIAHRGKSIVSPRQDKPHPESINLSPGEKYAVVTDLGTDQFIIYGFDAPTGKLTPHGMTPGTPGAGPRHLVFHPSGRFAYCTNELNSTVTTLSWKEDAGELKVLANLSSFPPDFKDKNIAGDIVAHPNGRFVYVTNRGHDSIAIFSVDPLSGTLTLDDYATSQGNFPWALAIDPDGRWMMVANQRSNSIVALQINQQTGKLASSGTEIRVPTPTCLSIFSAS